MAADPTAPSPAACHIPPRSPVPQPVRPEGRPYFAEVAHASGIDYEQSVLRTAPNCVFDEARSAGHMAGSGQPSMLFAPGYDRTAAAVLESGGAAVRADGVSCLAERNTGGAAAGDYDGDGLVDLFAARLDGGPLLYRNSGDGTFEDVSIASGLQQAAGDELGSGGSNAGAWVDVDNDGDLDLFVTTLGRSRHYLFINDGHGRFTEEAVARGARVTVEGDPSLTSGGSVGVADYDGDGWLDIYACEWRMYYTRDLSGDGHWSNSRLLRNLGASGKPGHFVDATEEAGVDLVPVARSMLERYHLTTPLPPGIDPKEQRVIPNGVYSFSPVWADLDSDGWVDLLLASDFGTSALFWNNGDGTFTEGAHAAGLGLEQNGMGATVGDVDGDGLLDVYVTAIFSDRPQDTLTGFGVAGSYLYHNDGARHFSDWTQRLGVGQGNWGWGTALFDYDNDGDLDLMALSGYIMTESTFDDEWNVTPSHLWQNPGLGAPSVAAPGASSAVEGSGQWEDVAEAMGVNDVANGRGLLVLDYDNDGDQDIVAVNYAGQPRLFRNDGAGTTGHTWLRVAVMERDGGRESIGARVSVAWQAAADREVTAVSVVGSVTAFQGQSDATAHFGMGKVATGTRAHVTVQWPPPSNARVVLEDVELNRTIVVWPSAADAGDAAAHANTRTCARAPPLQTLVDVSAGANTMLNMSRAIAEHMQARIVPATPRAEPPPISMSPPWQGLLTAALNGAAERRTHSINGVGNNPEHPRWGAAGTRLLRVSPVGYEDGVARPTGASTLPSARVVSNAVAAQDRDMPCPGGLTEAHVHFGQLLAHDLDHTTPQANAVPGEFYPIPVPAGDPAFDGEASGDQVIRFRRSIFDPSTGTGPDNPRQQVNKVTAFLDGSLLYGSDPGRLAALRTRDGARLATASDDAVLPPNAAGLPNDNPLGKPTQELRLAGDARANIQPGLLALHTLLVREHNHIATMMGLIQMRLGFGMTSVTLSDDGAVATNDDVFAAARAVVVAELQAITYNEYLPSILGPDAIPPYTGYNRSVNPGISNEFATVAFRFGHSQAGEDMPLVLVDGSTSRVIRQAEWYFRSRELLELEEGGVDPVLRGMLNRPAQAVDTRAVDAVRNFLFGSRAAGGVDLIATNIQRGRDHGIGTYNDVREALGLPRVASFRAACTDAAVADALASVYTGGVDTLDLLVGGLCEAPVGGGVVGETFRAIIVDQFVRLRDGDAYWYERVFEGEALETLRSTRLVDLVRRHVSFKRNTPLDRLVRRLQHSSFANAAASSWRRDAHDGDDTEGVGDAPQKLRSLFVMQDMPAGTTGSSNRGDRRSRRRHLASDGGDAHAGSSRDDVTGGRSGRNTRKRGRGERGREDAPRQERPRRGSRSYSGSRAHRRRV